MESKASRVTCEGRQQEQVQLLRRSPARLPLPGECRRVDRRRAGSVFQLSAQPGGPLSGHLERAGDQQAPVRGWRGRGAWQLAAYSQRSQRNPTIFPSSSSQPASAFNAADLQCQQHVPRCSQRVLRVLRHRDPCLQGGLQLEESWFEHQHGSPRQRELHVQQSRAGQHHSVCDTVSSNRTKTRISGSSSRISGPSSA